MVFVKLDQIGPILISRFKISLSLTRSESNHSKKELKLTYTTNLQLLSGNWIRFPFFYKLSRPKNSLNLLDELVG